MRVVIYADDNAEDALVLLKKTLSKMFQDVPTAALRGAEILDALWQDDDAPALHIVLATALSADFVMLANKLVVKHGIKSVLVAAYDITETNWFHLEESALWCYTQFCNHPKSLRKLCMMLATMELPKTVATSTELPTTVATSMKTVATSMNAVATSGEVPKTESPKSI